jgi:hypothetical protein
MEEANRRTYSNAGILTAIVRASVIILVLSFLCSNAYADVRCAAPPFGDTPAAYAKAQADLRLASNGDEGRYKILSRMWRAAMIDACKAKFAGGDRSAY